MRPLPPLTDSQKEDAHRLVSFRRHFLCNPIGSGKTRIALAAAQYLLDAKKVDRIVVVCPRPLKRGAWMDEADKAFPYLSVFSLEGTKKERPEVIGRIWAERPEVILVHFEQLIMPDVKDFLLKLTSREVVGFIVDEAHNLKDRKAKQHKSFATLAKRAAYCYLATGTPVENNPSELYNLFSLLDPQLLGSYKVYCSDFCVSKTIPILVRGRRVYISSPIRFREEAIERLRPTISRYMIKREKQDAEIPGLLVQQRLVEMGYRQRETYDRLLSDNILYDDNAIPVSADSPLVKLTRLRQVVSGSFVPPPCSKSLEATRLLEELQAAGRKCVLFSPFRQSLLRLESQLSQSFKTSMLIGGMTEAEQAESIAKFREEGDVLLMNEVGSEGLRLEFASAVIVYDLALNPAKLDQVIGRVHRRGQSTSVLAYYLLAEDSVDQQLWKLLTTKRHLMSQLDSLSKSDQERFAQTVLDLLV